MGKRLIVTGADFSVNGIPTEYQVLAWIGGTTKNSADTEAGVDLSQGQYISSGINTTANTRIVTEFMLGTTPGSCYINGGMISVPTCQYAWARSSDVAVQMMYVSGTEDNPDTSQRVQNTLTFSGSLWDGNKHTIDIDKTRVVLDGVEKTWNAATASTSTSPIYLDCVSQWYTGNYNTKDSTSSLKICRVKVYTDYSDPTSLVVDAIPAQRTSDRKVGFYNLVNGDWFFRNNDSTPTYGTL